MNIRPAVSADASAIYDLVKTAFLSAQVSDGNEQNFVYALRERSTYLPALELVAEDADGTLLGHLMLTKTNLTDCDGQARPALMAAPLCVRLENRSSGLGAELMHEGLRRARRLGFTSVFLVGDPAYYGRFGFVPVTELGLRNDTHAPDRVVLGRPIVPGGLDGADGGICLE